MPRVSKLERIMMNRVEDKVLAYLEEDDIDNELLFPAAQTRKKDETCYIVVVYRWVRATERDIKTTPKRYRQDLIESGYGRMHPFMKFSVEFVADGAVVRRDSEITSP